MAATMADSSAPDIGPGGGKIKSGHRENQTRPPRVKTGQYQRKSPPTEAALLVRGNRRGSIEQLRQRRHKLRWRERLCQHDAVRHALRSPIFRLRAAHVDDRECRVDL